MSLQSSQSITKSFLNQILPVTCSVAPSSWCAVPGTEMTQFYNSTYVFPQSPSSLVPRQLGSVGILTMPPARTRGAWVSGTCSFSPSCAAPPPTPSQGPRDPRARDACSLGSLGPARGHPASSVPGWGPLGPGPFLSLFPRARSLRSVTHLPPSYPARHLQRAGAASSPVRLRPQAVH